MVENENNNIGGIVNSEPIVTNNRKGPNVVLIIIFIIIAIGMGIGGFVLGTKYDKNKNNSKVETSATNESTDEIHNNEENPDTSENSDKLPTKNENYTFIEEKTTEIEYSGTKHKVVIYYYLDKLTDDFAGDEIVFYALRRDVFIDGNYVINSETYKLLESESDAKNEVVDNINFKILKDYSNSDEYLLVNGQEESWNGINGGVSKYVVIVNKNAAVIDKLESKNAYTDVYGVLANDSMLADRNYVPCESNDMFKNKDGKYILYSNSLLDIHDNFIYILDYEGYNNGREQAREYKYTITNGLTNKVEVTVYNGDRLSVAGQS